MWLGRVPKVTSKSLLLLLFYSWPFFHFLGNTRVNWELKLIFDCLWITTFKNIYQNVRMFHDVSWSELQHLPNSVWFSWTLRGARRVRSQLGDGEATVRRVSWRVLKTQLWGQWFLNFEFGSLATGTATASFLATNGEEAWMLGKARQRMVMHWLRVSLCVIFLCVNHCLPRLTVLYNVYLFKICTAYIYVYIHNILLELLKNIYRIYYMHMIT